MAEPPAEKPLVKPRPIEPAPSAAACRIASAMLVMPARVRFSAVTTVTGSAVCESVPRNSEPVTTTSPPGPWSLSPCVVLGSVGCCWTSSAPGDCGDGDCARAGAATMATLTSSVEVSKRERVGSIIV